MRDAQNIRDVESLGVDWMGFIFYPKSPRYVDTVPSYLPDNAKRVGVFVNESAQNIKQICSKYSLDIVQLHGNESPGMCTRLMEDGLTIIKALSVKDTFPTELSKSYQQACHYLLFDTHTADYGGSGNKFSWDIISDYQYDTPFLLSGGISANDAKSIMKINHPQLIGIDINSRFETKAAFKNVSLINQFIKQIRNYEQNR